MCDRAKSPVQRQAVLYTSYISRYRRFFGIQKVQDLKSVQTEVEPPRSPLQGDIPNKYPLYKVYMGLIIKGPPSHRAPTIFPMRISCFHHFPIRFIIQVPSDSCKCSSCFAPRQILKMKEGGRTSFDPQVMSAQVSKCDEMCKVCLLPGFASSSPLTNHT